MLDKKSTKNDKQTPVVIPQVYGMLGQEVVGHRPARQHGNKASSDLSNGTFILSDTIDTDTHANFVRFLFDVPNSVDGDVISNLKVIINSYGGSVYSGFGIIDSMRSCSIPISTIVTGTAASMASLISCAGNDGMRYIGANSRIMTHQFSSIFYGSDTEFKNNEKNHKQIREMIINHYVKHTNLTKGQVKKYLYDSVDTWLTAEKAINYGLADLLIPDTFPTKKQKKEKKT